MMRVLCVCGVRVVIRRNFENFCCAKISPFLGLCLRVVSTLCVLLLFVVCFVCVCVVIIIIVVFLNIIDRALPTATRAPSQHRVQLAYSKTIM